MLKYPFLESQNRRQCWTARTITKPEGSAKLPLSARREWLRSLVVVRKGVRGVSSVTFGHRCSQAPRASLWLIAQLLESGLGLILIWGFPWLFARFLSFTICLLKVCIFTQKSIFRKRYSADKYTPVWLYWILWTNGLYELIKCLQYEKCAHNKQNKLNKLNSMAIAY